MCQVVIVTSCRSARMLLLLSLIYVYTATQAYVITAVVSDPSQITCWTCPNKTDNEACNDWAPDKFCPLNHTICQTRHIINMHTGKSIRVLKQCAQPSQCTSDMIGCHPTGEPGIQECISCCNFAYCNEQAPSNHSTAFLYSSLPTNGAARPRDSVTSLSICFYLLFVSWYTATFGLTTQWPLWKSSTTWWR